MITKMKMLAVDKELVNSVLIGLVFMFLYSAYFTLANLEKLILHSVQTENPEYSGEGFISLSILYVASCLFMWFVPTVVNLSSVKLTLFVGAIGHSMYMASFLPEVGWVLYLGSALSGLGNAMIWTTQGVYNTLNSTASTVTRNTAIFFGLCHVSLLFGNLIVYFSFADKDTIDYSTRVLVVSLLLGLSCVGVVIAALLPRPAHSHEGTPQLQGTLEAIKESIGVIKNKYMLILCPMFIYNGLQVSFFSSVLGAVIGFTSYTEGLSGSQLVAVSGFFTGVGEILAEVVLISASSWLPGRRWLQSVLMMNAIIFSLVAFLLTLLNFANDSAFAPTNSTTIITSRSWIGVLIALLLGYSDGVMTPLMMTMVGKIFPAGNTSGFSFYNFLFSTTSAICFFYSTYVGLYWQLLILAVGGSSGLATYCYVNSKLKWD